MCCIFFFISTCPPDVTRPFLRTFQVQSDNSCRGIVVYGVWWCRNVVVRFQLSGGMLEMLLYRTSST